MLESTLLSAMVQDGPVFWGGIRVPAAGIDNSHDLFQAVGDFRMPPSEHGRYRAVYLVEHDLGLWKQWPLILDEALRLFQYGQCGSLFVRFSETELLTAFAFVAYLRRRTDFTFELAYQDAFSNGTISYCVRCQREENEPALSSFEFALITDGRRPEAVARFVASVAAIRSIDMIDWKVAICGPAEFGKAFENADPHIRYINAPVEHASRGWITRKKNLIVATSNADNLLIAHDRYETPPAFLEQLFEFGADFSVIVPGQYDDSDEAFPDWVALGSQWTKSACAMLEHGDYSPHGYVNGGVIIAKRQILLDTPWSDLLFWGQYEDVELSRALAAAGVTPRLAREVKLRVTAMRPGYTDDFARLPNLPSNYVLPRVGAHRTELHVGEFPLGDTLDFNGTTNLRTLAEAGIVAAAVEWQFGTSGLVLLQRNASLSINVPQRGKRSYYLTVYMPAYPTAPLLLMKANGMPLAVRWTESGTGLRCGSAQLDAALLASTSRLTLAFTADTDAMLLTGLGVSAQDGGGSKMPLGYSRVNGMVAGIFREGWGEPEPWGIWTVAAHAHMQLPIASLPVARDVEVSITATAFGPTPGSTQIVGIACNGVPLICVSIPTQVEPARFSIRIPRALIRTAPMIKLTFTPAFPMTPDAAGRGPDGRLLGFGLISMDARAA
jgi:hypothetical protein